MHPSGFYYLTNRFPQIRDAAENSAVSGQIADDVSAEPVQTEAVRQHFRNVCCRPLSCAEKSVEVRRFQTEQSREQRRVFVFHGSFQ